MKRLSTLIAASLIALIFCASAAYPDSPAWPIRQDIDLSSGFGDYRNGRFHAGVDIRTGGHIGRRLSAPVDGYIQRLRTSYDGYGKAIYLQGIDGYIYVFAHLDSFAPEIDRVVKQRQVAARRYSLDISLPAGSIAVKKGQDLGRTGQTGATAPHLHYEKRTTDNVPINPLAHGYQLNDSIPPSFIRIDLAMTDQSSLFSNGKRRLSLDVVRDSLPGEFGSDSVIYLNRPFGLLVDGYDLMRNGGMKQAIYRLAVHVDGDIIYETILDTVDYDRGYEAGFEYDILKATQGEKRVRRLYFKDSLKYSGSRAFKSHGGIVGQDSSLGFSRHEARIVAEDCSGNRSELNFAFLWGRDSDPFTLDSTVHTEHDSTEFYFSPRYDLGSLEIDSVFVQRNIGEQWGQVKNATVVYLKEGMFRVEVPASGIRSAVLRLVAKSKHGCHIICSPFNGIRDKAGKGVTLTCDPVGDGLVVSVKTTARNASEAHLAFFYRDNLLGREFPTQFFSMNKYCFFVPPRPEYSRVDRIDLVWSYDTTARATFRNDITLAAVGYQERQVVRPDSGFSLEIGRENLFRPQYILIKKDIISAKTRMSLNSDLYTVLPEALVTRQEFGIKFDFNDVNRNDSVSGICWLDEEKDEWVWLKDNALDGSYLSASSLGGGRFAAIYDHQPPKIEHLSLVSGRTVDTPYPEIKFMLTDDLSGFADDRSINIRIDGQWMIPEYNPHTGWCKTTPVDPLEPGKHRLSISVIDRAGNKAEQALEFYVKDNKK